ncbi:FAD/NAD(P)-binding domain-containing protein [Penicillium taxi]|uniref:FAD/NAD(P)-binding domain-containing protein n=1 Tax=Penicillium taxi TaxID=168475 RepID=UPI002545460B|nr:FAD/NAD(P)-binding domain-containing protein [Penicillium taxi]KAJ5902027.1 FAD/NAD(P)-binding domain-containing protein [Penicillium taxi]
MVIKIITPIILYQCSSVEVKESSEERFDKKLHQAIDRTVNSESCGSYFIDGETNKNWFVYPWNSFHLWLSTIWETSEDWEYQGKN